MEDIFNQTENNLGSFRLRSERRRRRDKIADKDKILIRLYKENKELRKQKRALPMIDLFPPIQRGWKRYFVLREDVRRSKMGNFYENLLLKINTFQYDSSKIFKKKIKRGGKKIYVDREQELKIIYRYELPKYKFDERQLACFEYQIVWEVVGRNIREKHIYVFKEPWRYVLRIRPNIIDKVRVLDSELEQRIAELDGTLYENYVNKGRLTKLRGWGKYDWVNKLKYENPLKDKSLNKIIEEFG